MNHLLTFELDKDADHLLIHGNVKGLRLLAKMLEELAAKAERGNTEHHHLFTEEWGGKELSSEPQYTDGAVKLLNHVKVYGWPSSSGVKAYTDT